MSNMSKYLIAVIVVIAGFAKSQTISNYQFLSVPKTFEKSNNMNSYNLRNILVEGLGKKNFTVLPNVKENWPAEIVGNNCSFLEVKLLDDSSFLRNKVRINFVDCNGKIVFDAKGGSSIKELETGFPDALKNALATVPMLDKKSILSTNISTGNKTETITKASTNNNSSGIFYRNNGEDYQLIKLTENQHLLTSPKSSIPFAKLIESSKLGVFHVILNNKSTTLGYRDQGNIIIELPTGENSYKKEIFNPK